MANGGYIDGSKGLDIHSAVPPPPSVTTAGDTPPIPSTTGWCPFAQRMPVPHFWVGRSNFDIRAVVLHIAQGSYEATYQTFLNENVSAHFCVAKDGRIAQYVSIDDSAWGNGIVTNPSWPDLIPGQNPNFYTISIEHEGVYTDPWTQQMYDANLKLLQWIRDTTGLSYQLHHSLIGHYEIDSVTRANCPGPNVDWTRIVADLVKTDVGHAALIAGANKFGIPLNDQAALAHYAIQNHLGIPLTDEYPFSVNGVAYVGQIWSKAIVYVKVGDWSNIQVVQ